MPRQAIPIAIVVLCLALSACATQTGPEATDTPLPSPTIIPTSTPSPVPSDTPAPTSTPTASPTPTATPFPTVDLPAFSPVARQDLEHCELTYMTQNSVTRAMNVRCRLAEGAGVYAAIDGRTVCQAAQHFGVEAKRMEVSHERRA